MEIFLVGLLSCRTYDSLLHLEAVVAGLPDGIGPSGRTNAAQAAGAELAARNVNFLEFEVIPACPVARPAGQIHRPSLLALQQPCSTYLAQTQWEANHIWVMLRLGPFPNYLQTLG